MRALPGCVQKMHAALPRKTPSTRLRAGAAAVLILRRPWCGFCGKAASLRHLVPRPALVLSGRKEESVSARSSMLLAPAVEFEVLMKCSGALTFYEAV